MPPENKIRFRDCPEEDFVEVQYPDGRVEREIVCRLPLDEQRILRRIYRDNVPRAYSKGLVQQYDPRRCYRPVDVNHGYVFTQPADAELAKACGWPEGATELLLLNITRKTLEFIAVDGSSFMLANRSNKS